MGDSQAIEVGEEPLVSCAVPENGNLVCSLHLVDRVLFGACLQPISPCGSEVSNPKRLPLAVFASKNIVANISNHIWPEKQIQTNTQTNTTESWIAYDVLHNDPAND